MADNTSAYSAAQRRSRAKRNIRAQIFGTPLSIKAGDPFVLSAEANSETGDRGNYFSEITFATSIKVTSDTASGTILVLGSQQTRMILRFIAGQLHYEIGDVGLDSEVVGIVPHVGNGYEGDIVLAILPFYSKYSVATKVREPTVALVKIYGRENRLYEVAKSKAPMVNGWSMEQAGAFGGTDLDPLVGVEIIDDLWVFEDTLPKNFYGNQRIYSDIPKTSPSDPNANDGQPAFDDGFSDGFDTEEMTNG